MLLSNGGSDSVMWTALSVTMIFGASAVSLLVLIWRYRRGGGRIADVVAGQALFMAAGVVIGPTDGGGIWFGLALGTFMFVGLLTGAYFAWRMARDMFPDRRMCWW